MVKIEWGIIIYRLNSVWRDRVDCCRLRGSGVNGVSGGYLNKMRTREQIKNKSEEKTKYHFVVVGGGGKRI